MRYRENLGDYAKFAHRAKPRSKTVDISLNLLRTSQITWLLTLFFVVTLGTNCITLDLALKLVACMKGDYPSGFDGN